MEMCLTILTTNTLVKNASKKLFLFSIAMKRNAKITQKNQNESGNSSQKVFKISLGLEARKKMSKSNYEKYAEVKQQELLHKERNLQQAISCLRDRQKFASLQYIDSAMDFVADLYDLSIDEVKRAMDREEYWCI